MMNLDKFRRYCEKKPAERVKSLRDNLFDKVGSLPGKQDSSRRRDPLNDNFVESNYAFRVPISSATRIPQLYI